jgi:septum formation protein
MILVTKANPVQHPNLARERDGRASRTTSPVRDHLVTTAAQPRPLVLLASRSPRRQELLRAAGIDFVAAQPALDDGDLHPGSVDAERWVAAMAYLKSAAAVRQGLHTALDTSRPIGVVLGADTVVSLRGRIIGQPRDRADAERIIRQLADAEHDVLTGVAMLCPATGRRDIWTDRARVDVGSIDDAEIERYLDSGAWRGKAGAYNLSERLAAGWPIRYTGDAGTIMGLPAGAVARRLDAWTRA